MSITAAVASLRPTIERLAEFAALPPEWDSYGSLPASPRAVATATELLVLLADRLSDLAPECLTPFAVAPISDGGVQLEWQSPTRAIEVEIGPDGEVGYLLIEGHGEQRQFGEQSEVPLKQALDRVTLVLVGGST